MTQGHRTRVLQVHNSYRLPGGEDRVVATEAQLLRDRGHEVLTYARRTPSKGEGSVLRLAGQTFWNHRAYTELRQLIKTSRPDVVHLHNTFPLISPAACYAAQRERVAVVQTLHNYRLFCPNGLFFRDGRPCEDCLHKSVPWPAVLHACYRGSRVASLAAGGTFAAHHALGTWATQVDRYVALTKFAQQKFVEGGLPPEKVTVKPNAVHPDHGPGTGDGGHALFVGRLSHEKGIQTVIAAWGSKHPMPLIVAGDGPLAPVVQRAVAENSAVTWVGHRSPDEVQELVGRAACVIVPSICYETFGLVVAEAFARGTPVIAARNGALAELVEHGQTGLQFIPGNVEDLQRQVAWVAEHPLEVSRMRIAARTEYETRYSIDSNYPVICRIYSEAIASRRARDTRHS